ncbi:carbohydrate porin [Prochlorococcus sp. AH-716-P05]|nr:carbohydrate porin [Prochlorococcus sp. AH-716-P05]
MKLFQKLIAAPAIISLASGFAVNAAEINSKDLSDFSNSNNLVSLGDFRSDTLFPGDWAYDSLKDLTNSPKFNGNSVTRLEAAAELNNLIAGGEGLMNGAAIGRLSDELGSELAIMKGRVDGLEARVNGIEAGSFSETTTMSGSVGFLIGATDSASGQTGANNNDTVQFEYSLGIDLNSSFTGDDKLNIGIVTGNGLTNVGADKTGLDWGESENNVLTVNDVNYTFPVGAWTIAVGDSMDASKTWPNACSMNNMVDNLGDCGAANSVDLSGDVSFSAATVFGDGWEIGIGASGGDGSGLFTEQSTDAYGLAVGYETDAYGLTAAYSDKDTASYYGLTAYYSPEGLPATISGGFEFGTPEGTGEDTTQWAFGISSAVGEGTLSANVGTNGQMKDSTTDVYAYDLSYEYPINDSMSVTPFVYVSEIAGSDNTTGAGAFVSFSF